MSGYGRNISVGTWGDAKFCRLSAPQPNAQTLWLYLLTGPETTNMPGVLRVGRAALAEALGWSLEDLVRCSDEIEGQGMLKADWAKRIVWMPNALKHSYSLAPDNVRAFRKPMDSLPDCPLKIAIYEGVEAFLQGEANRNPKQRNTLQAFLESVPRPTFEGTPPALKKPVVLVTPPASDPPTPPGGKRGTPPQDPVPVKDPVKDPGGGKGRTAATTNGASAKEASSKKAPPPPTEKLVGRGDSEKGSDAFLRFQIRRTARTGRTPEPTPPGVKEFETEALGALKRDGWTNPSEGLDATMDAFFADPKPHWKLRGFPWAAFRKQWEEFIPLLVPNQGAQATGEPAPEAPWEHTESGKVWRSVLNALAASGKNYCLTSLEKCGVQPVAIESGMLVLHCADAYGADWLAQNYGELLGELVGDLHDGIGLRVDAQPKLRLVSPA